MRSSRPLAGGMGEVYRARDTRLGRDVATKVLPPHLSASPELKERFDREAHAISSLNQARICTLHDVGHQDGVDFLVMEYLEGHRYRRPDRQGNGALEIQHKPREAGLESRRKRSMVCDRLPALRLGRLHPGRDPRRQERTVLTMPSIRLHDISKDGHILLSHENWRRQLVGLFPGDKQEHPYTWMDDTTATSITADGRWMSFTESGEVYYIAGEVLGFYRPTDGSPAVSVGPGITTISPDGKRIAVASHASHKLLIQPVGLGETAELPTPGLTDFANMF